MRRRPQLVIDLRDDGAFRDFQAWLSGKGCPEDCIVDAFEVVKRDQSGEYNTATRRVTYPDDAYAVKAMMSLCNAEAPPPRRFEPLAPGEFAIEFEHRRLEPSKVDLWFRSGNA